MVEQQYPHMSQQIIDPRIQSAANMFGNATSGRDTLANIEQTIEDLRAKERALQVELEVINTTRSNCIEQRLTAYRELAEVRARHAISDGVIDEADRLSTRVASLLIARQKTMADLKQRLAKSDDTRATLIRARQALADRIEQLEVALDRLALEAREALTNNPDYRQERRLLKKLPRRTPRLPRKRLALQLIDLTRAGPTKPTRSLCTFGGAVTVPVPTNHLALCAGSTASSHITSATTTRGPITLSSTKFRSVSKPTSTRSA
jgi:chromosome segregation ATPase